MPWKPKDRILMEPPICLSDSKYGKHKYVTLNVNLFFSICDLFRQLSKIQNVTFFIENSIPLC